MGSVTKKNNVVMKNNVAILLQFFTPDLGEASAYK